MKFFNILLLHASLSVFAMAQLINTNADCIMLEDENSIICKYTHPRVEHDTNITVQWIDPKGKISRNRDMVIPAYHGSVYDYRYLMGRMDGIWEFKVLDHGNEITTKFEIKK